MKPRKVGLTDQELEIMKVVWKLGKATVREVYEELLEQRKIAYTTVQTMMGVLEHKGRLKKETADRAYVYRPAQPQSEVVGGMVGDFVKRVFNGSAKPLLVHLVESKRISQAHLDEINELLKAQRGRK
jgi:BlaI family transcriptional regulator, penicillinase repressor